MRPGRQKLAHMSALLAALGSVTALAEPVPSLDLRAFHPPADPKGALFLEPAATPGPGNFNVVSYLSYAHELVVLEDADGSRVAVPLEHQLSLDYAGSIGIGERLALGATLPTVLYQTGDDVAGLLAADPLPRTALGDAAFLAKAALVPSGALGGFGLAALARVTAPVGDRASYVADGAVTGELRVLGELRLIALDVRATAGAKVRGAERTFVGEEFGHDLPWGVGLTFRPQVVGLDDAGRWQWNAELRGAIALTPNFAAVPQSPVLWGLSARRSFGDVSLLGGIELPITDAVGSPTVRAVISLAWAPRFYDMDSDGVGDDEDECPELAEDGDGFQDADGCPDDDDDEDGVSDGEDRCPAEKEDEDEFQDQDGCPDLDNDGDGIVDAKDACPNQFGPRSADPKQSGCTTSDRDRDGIVDAVDRCPDSPEDRDGWKDDDGCPDEDDDRDGDGVLDEEDACPTVPGAARSDPKLNGCASPDSDGDTWDDPADRCPDRPEDFDGVEDDDGCPDAEANRPPAQRGRPLVLVEQRPGGKVLVSQPVRFVAQRGAVDLDAKSMFTMRAMAQLLNQNPSWVVLVGVRPVDASVAASQEALSRSFAVVHALRQLSHRDEVAESVGWTAVSAQPGSAASGVGFLLLAADESRATPPATVPAKPSTPHGTRPTNP
jgi:OOP family OmpA-OmpF porin